MSPRSPHQGATATAFEIVANGETRSVEPGTSIAGFLADHRIDPATVVVERNGRILPREELDATSIRPGDALEIVHFVGGG